MSGQQELTAIILPDGKFQLTVSKIEFEEICHALSVVQRKREAAKKWQRKNAEKIREEKMKNPEPEIPKQAPVRRRAINLAIKAIQVQ